MIIPELQILKLKMTVAVPQLGTSGFLPGSLLFKNA